MDIKIVGYALLTSGLIVILFAGFNVFNILSRNARAFDYFNLPAIKVSLVPDTPEVEILPAAALNETSNLFAHLFALGLIVTIGAKVSSIGVEMLRPIKVNLREEKTNEQKVQTK